MNVTRDINSRENAFLSRESQFLGLDQDSRFCLSTYLLPAWLELDCRHGRERQMRGPCRSIDIASGGVPETSQNGWGRGLQGERDRGSAMANRPPGRQVGESPPTPVGCLWTISWHRRWDGHAKWWATAGSPAPWHTCQHAGWECNRRTLSPTSPRVWETTSPPSDVASRLADISLSFLFPIQADWSSRICTGGPMHWHN